MNETRCSDGSCSNSVEPEKLALKRFREKNNPEKLALERFKEKKEKQ